MKEKMTYEKAGVNIGAGDKLVERIKPQVKTTFRPEVLTEIGGFGGLFKFDKDKYEEPILVSSTDGVGTKLKIAFMMDKHDTIGIDLVAMCVNDLIVQGAEPLFLLDYIATDRLIIEKVEEIIKGIVCGCREAGCVLIGGETAEMPGFYNANEYDLAGFTVGVVDRDKLINGSGIARGDVLVGISSSGIHSNGFSLVRKIIFDILKLDIGDRIEDLKLSIGEELIKPTKIYVKTILALLNKFKIKGIAHITGGGLIGNIPRILPENCQAVIRKGSWKPQPVFSFLQKAGHVSEEEMFKTFNMGIGMVLVISAEEKDLMLNCLNDLDEEAYLIGEIVEGEKGVKVV